MEDLFPQPDLSTVFRAEILAARMEGALRADASLAAMWRGLASVQEACASTWLEDLPVSPVDLLGRPFRASLGDPDRDRAALAGAAMLRGLHSPGPLEEQTGTVLSRLWSLSAGEGPHPFMPQDYAEIRDAMAEAPSPLLGALAVARIVHVATEGNAPSVERLALVAADHAMRGSGRFMLGEAEPYDLVSAPRGAWVIQPSLALVDNGFRLWSVAHPGRVRDLLEGLTRTLDRGIAALPLLRRWLERSRDIRADAHGASRMPDLIGMLTLTPIVTGSAVARDLNITPRGAQKLIDQAESLELITKITPRRTYRAWATTPFARMLGRG
ncbi:helix-turn-helix domain-containing protein [Chachezhania sediminis]|uniref:helix-turn-helix domain-containing protein n=1 Tax=Chachezhania sediminis TaxID=2599291 RepID=UPI00131E88BB|nr:helix-turn-helix domain-containing protein [Chachezhania sediminis]